MKYGAAVQDIYGQWSLWTSGDQVVSQPDLDPVRLGTVRLIPIAPASGSVCPTTLQLDFYWDWRVRSPKLIKFIWRMYVAATHGDPPPSVAVPPGFDRSLVGGDAAITGDTPSTADGTIIPLTEDGESQALGFGAAQGTNRRYRLTVMDLSAVRHSSVWRSGRKDRKRSHRIE